ncbi:AsnC family transcriptional regulator [Acidihalobacter ferrooxydans]|uniref:AsnC family transcriptional regulator n=1 Tax=Acidihalobacter ferrooxydans TaxID=1765967 RepID=A0A1P8UL63_9GAMM|nr:AsnC family transcriptional regulator [Acidihalobacter ferrooxydans]
MRLDRYDLAILAALQRDGRMSKQKLSEAIHLSPTPCWERLKRLERDGLIRGYRAELAIGKLLDVAHFMVEVTLSRHRQEDFVRFEEEVESHAEILSCYAVAGGFDYLLMVVAENIRKYQQNMESWLTEKLGVERYFTYVVTKTVKEARYFPLDEFWSARNFQ